MMQMIDTLLSTVIKLSAPGGEIPVRLIRKVNQYLVELELHGLMIGQPEFAALFDTRHEMKGISNPPDVLLNSALISTLTDNLGCNLSVHPLDGLGTLIRLAIPCR